MGQTKKTVLLSQKETGSVTQRVKERGCEEGRSWPMHPSQLWLHSRLAATASNPHHAPCQAHPRPPLGAVSGCLGQITLAGAQADARPSSTEWPLCWDDKPQSQANICRIKSQRAGKVSWGEERPEWNRRTGDKGGWGGSVEVSYRELHDNWTNQPTVTVRKGGQRSVVCSTLKPKK